jgi:hypothetical protein
MMMRTKGNGFRVMSNAMAVKKVTVWAVLFVLMTSPLVTRHSLYGAFKDAGWGVRPMGMGGAFVAVADDSNALLFNPAGVYQAQQPEISVTSAKLFTGLEGVDAGVNYLGALYPMGESAGSVGVTWTSLYAGGLYREDTGSLTYGRSLYDLLGFTGNTDLALGVNIKYLQHQYVTDAQSEQDPVFSRGTSAGAVTFDGGALVSWPEAGLSLALVSRNITRPDVGLRTPDPVPNENALGVAYYREGFLVGDCITFALDAVSREKRIDYHAGAEAWFLGGKLAVRAGAQTQELDLGLGYEIRLSNDATVVVDYAMGWPLEIEKTSGTHRLGVTFRFP